MCSPSLVLRKRWSALATRERGRRTVGVLTGSLLARLRELQPYLTTSKALSNDEDAKEESPILMEGVGPVQDLRENHVHFEIVKLPTCPLALSYLACSCQPPDLPSCAIVRPLMRATHERRVERREP